MSTVAEVGILPHQDVGTLNEDARRPDGPVQQFPTYQELFPLLQVCVQVERGRSPRRAVVHVRFPATVLGD